MLKGGKSFSKIKRGSQIYMNSEKFICTKTDEISKTFEVESVLAKVIEERGMSKEEFTSLGQDYDFDRSIIENGEAFFKAFDERVQKKEKFLFVADTALDSLFAVLIFIRLLATIKVPFEVKYIHRDEYALKGNILIIRDHSITLYNRQEDLSITMKEDPLALATIACTIASAYNLGKYSLALGGIGVLCSASPLLKQNRTLFNKARAILEEERYFTFERIMITKEKRNNMLLYGGDGHVSYNAPMIRARVIKSLEAYLSDNEKIHWNRLLQYFLNPKKEGGSYQKFGEALSMIKTDGDDEPLTGRAIVADLEEITRDAIKEMEKALEPYGVGNMRPRFLVEDAEIESIRKFDMSRGLELSFRTSHGLVKSTAYNTPIAHTRLKKGGHVTMSGSLYISSFSGLPTLKMETLEVLK
jgi:hypothetical protein